MSFINPLAAAFAQTAGVSRNGSAAKSRETRAGQAASGVGPTERLEHDVETLDAVELNSDQPERHSSDDSPDKEKHRPEESHDSDNPPAPLDVCA